jgi:hypothetical protein
MADEQPTSPGGDFAALRAREKSSTGRRRLQLAEDLADRAVVAEGEGNHKAAADLYRQAIDTLTLVSEAKSG